MSIVFDRKVENRVYNVKAKELHPRTSNIGESYHSTTSICLSLLSLNKAISTEAFGVLFAANELQFELATHHHSGKRSNSVDHRVSAEDGDSADTNDSETDEDSSQNWWWHGLSNDEVYEIERQEIIAEREYVRHIISYLSTLPHNARASIRKMHICVALFMFFRRFVLDWAELCRYLSRHMSITQLSITVFESSRIACSTKVSMDQLLRVSPPFYSPITEIHGLKAFQMHTIGCARRSGPRSDEKDGLTCPEAMQVRPILHLGAPVYVWEDIRDCAGFCFPNDVTRQALIKLGIINAGSEEKNQEAIQTVAAASHTDSLFGGPGSTDASVA